MKPLFFAVAFALLIGTAPSLMAQKGIRTNLSRPDATQPVYLGAANLFLVKTKGKGIPSFSSCTGKLEVEKGKLYFTPDPQLVSKAGGKAEIIISANGKTEKLEFDVAAIPAPRVEIFDGNKKASPKRPVTCQSKLTAEVIPDPNFAVACPRDAAYMVTSTELILKRNAKAAWYDRVGNGDIAGFCVDMEEGDQLVVTVEEIKRTNANGQLEKVALPQFIAIYDIKNQ
jgi:hypothetical protein